MLQLRGVKLYVVNEVDDSLFDVFMLLNEYL